MVCGSFLGCLDQTVDAREEVAQRVGRTCGMRRARGQQDESRETRGALRGRVLIEELDLPGSRAQTRSAWRAPAAQPQC
jgi:hypothetical protein